MLMDDSVAVVTLSVAVPLFPVEGSLAVIVTGPPAPRPVAIPLKPVALSIVATVALDDVQVTDDVRFLVVKFEYVPVAINCCVPPTGIRASAGVTTMDDSTAEVTVSVAVPAFPEAGSVAVIVMALPVAFAVATPFEPVALLTVATVVFEDDQVTEDVRSRFVRSE